MPVMYAALQAATYTPLTCGYVAQTGGRDRPVTIPDGER